LKQPEKEPANRSTTVYAKLASSTVWVRPTATNQRAAGVIVSLERKLILTTLQAVGSEELIEIAFPRYRDSELIAEEGPYRDRLGCWIDGSRTMGMVLLRDPVRDLALIEVDDLPKNLEAVRFTEAIPEIGAKIHSVNHPMGIELLWLESQGIIKQRAQIDHLKKEGQDQAIDTLLLQLPSQAGSSGGGISNASGELIGLTLSRESPQQQLGYAVALSEIRTALARPNPLAKPTDSTEWLKRADFALQLNRFHTARVAFEMSDSVAPSNASRFGILRCLVLSSKFDHAEKFLRDWEREHPDHRNLPLAKAMLNRSRNRPEAVLNLLGGKVESAVLLSERGEAYRLLKKFEEARADLEQSLQIDAQQGDAHRFLARLEADQQRFDQALAAYSRSLELQPYHQETIRERSQVWSRKKEWRRAISDLERLLDLEPRDGSGWFELGRNRLLLGDDSKAISDLIAATRVDGKLHFKVRSLLLERADELAPTDEKRASGILKQYLDQRIRFEVNMKAKEELATIAKTLPTIREGERYRWLKGQLTPERE
jgi:tetratricopeptide (TPR) repeat protein